MKKRFSQYSLWLSLLGIVIGVGQYFTPIYSSNILYIGIFIYLIGFLCGVIAFGNHEKGLMKYFSLTSFVVIPLLIMLGMLFFAMSFGEN
ncbi:hypothetical protein COK01_24245 [Priestia megaterium]|uniref:hypothetical protein n=1 Tax=Priestia megaterium TaxID=1404 RepID=UPI000BF8A9FB|nr:hypothetical protein [Priestia megaterium]RFB20954.1 hypothetical protein DZB87_26215 [Bacillus sp. ALD]RFB32600.1 hypothetical protein DZB86_29645 [Bacillus sp. RC]MCR8866018.1 hypothetical protein [Priestia megaterium]PFK64878.1 hypothetical protein COJ21_25300 [Priestia megaterium]PFP45503.1 hypothetical protein COK01_24245 [Priestia megaterium]